MLGFKTCLQLSCSYGKPVIIHIGHCFLKENSLIVFCNMFCIARVYLFYSASAIKKCWWHHLIMENASEIEFGQIPRDINGSFKQKLDFKKLYGSPRAD